MFKDLIKNHFQVILNIVFWIPIFFFLFIISFVNIENIFQHNFSDTYTLFYYLYLIFSVAFLIWLRFLKLRNSFFKEEVLYTIKSLVYLSIFIFPALLINHHFIIEHISESNLYLRSYWRIAFLYLSLALIISPILKFIKNNTLRDNLILIRKILWILSFIFFLKHGLEYFASEYIFQIQLHSDVSYFQYVYENMLVRYDAMSWAIAWILMLLLWITSNKVSVKLLTGKFWKSLQSLAYPLFLISIIHIAFASRFEEFYIFLTILVVSVRTISYLTNKKEKESWKTTKYICIPCWYIYDESVWDPDGWIEPWTKFEDIPDNWRCPVCWVSKADFEPYYDSTNTLLWWYITKISSYNMLTEDVLEVSLKLSKKIEVLKWQYAILILKDFDSEFSRSYSIVSYKDNTLTFGIKLKDTWRWSRVLKSLKIWNQIKIKWIYWEFVLKDTNNPKVFIATWTWLSPIINMINEPLKSENNILLFGVQSYKDLFYLDKINNIENLETKIYLSREEKQWFKYGRINLEEFDFDKNSEFYICWNPWLVSASIDYLEKAWYKNIYFEKFN